MTDRYCHTGKQVMRNGQHFADMVSVEAAQTTACLFNQEPRPRRFSDWHEEHGNVLWWRNPICEPPYVGSPLDLGRTMKVEIYIGTEQHEFDAVNTGGWPFTEDDELDLWWTPLPNAQLIQDRIPR